MEGKAPPDLPDTGRSIRRPLESGNRADSDDRAGGQPTFLIRAVHGRGLL